MAESFKRVILGLHQHVPRHGVHVAAEWAALLRVELCGLLVEDDELTHLAALPFAREFRPLEGGWHALDHDRLSRDRGLASERAQRSFAEVARRPGISCRLEVVRGSMAQAISAMSGAGDIVVISEPMSPADRVTLQFRSTVDAALGSAAAVMMMPPRIARQLGPVVAVAAAPGDPCIEVATVVAALAREELVIVEAFEGGGAQTVLPARRLLLGRRGRDVAALAASLQPVQERLLVVTRGAWVDGDAAALAVARHVPVLIVEPAAVA